MILLIFLVIFFFDTGALDSTTGREVMRLFDELNQRGHTIVMITHDANIAACAKRTVKIIDGVLSETV